MTHVPFKGTSESVPALLGGHVDVAFSAYPSLSGAVGTKNITLLGTNGAKRSAMAPDVPPIAEFIPGFVFAPTIGIYARTGTPPSDHAEDRQRSRPRSSRSRRSSSSSPPPASSPPAAGRRNTQPSSSARTSASPRPSRPPA